MHWRHAVGQRGVLDPIEPNAQLPAASGVSAVYQKSLLVLQARRGENAPGLMKWNLVKVILLLTALSISAV